MTPEELLYLHVTGTDKTFTLSCQAVRDAVAQGRLAQSQLIWHPTDNAWKPIREWPDLVPANQKPSPIAPTAAAPLPKAVPASPTVRSATPQVAVKAQASAAGAPTPQVARRAVAAVPTPRVTVSAVAQAGRRTGRSVVVDDADDDSHLLRWLCIIPGLLIAALIGLNYFLVDSPLVSALAQTGFPKTTVYAHLGAFVQPNALVIHIPKGSTVTSDNLPEFLVALARSTPAPLVGGTEYGRVCLTTGMTSHYTFSGSAWKQLGDMADEPADRRKAFILDEAGDSAGTSIIPSPVKIDGKYVDQRDKTWDAFVAYFAP